MPNYVCKDCEFQLGIAHSFRQQCRKSNAQLKKLLLSQFTGDEKSYILDISDIKIDQINEAASFVPNNLETHITDNVDELSKDDIKSNCSDDRDVDDNYSDTESKCENEGDKVQENGKKNQCRHCGKTFRLESSLKTHLLKHGKSCEVCGKKFNRK